MKKNSHKFKLTVSSAAEYCNYTCGYSRFAPPDSSGACRKEEAVWCSLVKKYNNKNNKCIAKKRI